MRLRDRDRLCEREPKLNTMFRRRQSPGQEDQARSERRARLWREPPSSAGASAPSPWHAPGPSGLSGPMTARLFPREPVTEGGTGESALTAIGSWRWGLVVTGMVRLYRDGSTFAPAFVVALFEFRFLTPAIHADDNGNSAATLATWRQMPLTRGVITRPSLWSRPSWQHATSTWAS